MNLKELFEKNIKLKHLLRTTKKEDKCLKQGRHLKQDIAQQGFYGDDDGSPRIFKPGEFVTEEIIGKYKIPAHLFIHPDSLRNMGAFKFAAKRKDTFSVGIIRTIKGLGDVLALSVIGKALKEQYPGKVDVWFAVYPGHEVLLKNNPYVDKIFISEKALMEAQPDIHLNVNDLEFRTELRENEKIICNRTALYLNKMGLSVENKTPTYIVTEREKTIAQEMLQQLGYDLKKSIIGIQKYGSNISKTYPHMVSIVKKLKKQEYQIFYLDSKPYKYGLREIAAIANEMSLIITPNSFFYHLAGALRKRAIALFGYTDGRIWTEDYEKVTHIQIPCPKGKERCWWRIECIPGKNLQEKETKITPECLSKIPAEMVIKEVDNHLLKSKRILILILTYDCLNLTKRMVDSIRTFHNYDLFVVDNGSTDGTQEWLKKQKINHISKKMTVCQACNIGLQKAWKEKYDYMMLCSNDIVLAGNYIDTIIETAERRKSYLTVGKCFNLESLDDVRCPELLRKVERSIIDLPGGGFSATLISRECMAKVGKFDESFYPRYQEDEDYLLRVRLSGNELIETYATNFLHLSGGVIKSHSEEMKNVQHNWNNNVAIFVEKWGVNPYNQRQELFCLNGIKKIRPKWANEIRISILGTLRKVRRKQLIGCYPIDIIKENIKKSGQTTVLVIRRMGGFGDVLFTTVLARALKNHYGNKVHITYAVLKKYEQVLQNNPFIDRIFLSDNMPTIVPGGFDSVIDLTDYEYQTELAEIEAYGKIRTPRTQIYFDLVKIKGRIKPDYFVSKEEKDWARIEWKKIKGKKQKIVIVGQGSNMMRTWPHAGILGKELQKRDFRVFEMRRRKGEYVYTFRHNVALISCADLVVSINTGMSNIAAALGIPTVTIFGSRNGKIFAKMFKTMIPIQGNCPHFSNKNYCDYTIPCLSGGLKNYRKQENIKIPDCLQNLGPNAILKKIYEVLK